MSSESAHPHDRATRDRGLTLSRLVHIFHIPMILPRILRVETTFTKERASSLCVAILSNIEGSTFCIHFAQRTSDVEQCG